MKVLTESRYAHKATNTSCPELHKARKRGYVISKRNATERGGFVILSGGINRRTIKKCPECWGEEENHA